MNPDNALVLFFLLCKTTASDEPGENTQNLLANEWGDLVDFCNARGVAPYLYGKLTENHLIDLLPAESISRLKQRYLTNAAVNLAARNQLAEILQALEAQKIPVIPLKGIHLIARAYQNPATRTMSDLDILLKKDDLPKTIETLKNIGYIVDTNFWESPGHHLPPVKKPNFLFPVEVHWRLSPPSRTQTISTETLWGGARITSIDGHPCFELDPAHTLIHICQHAAYQHYFANGIKAICDIDAIVRFYNKKMNWELFQETANAMDSARGIYLALWISKNFLGTPVPVAVDGIFTEFNFHDDIIADALSSMAGGVEFPDNPPVGLAEKIKWWTGKAQKVLREASLGHSGAEEASPLSATRNKAGRFGYVIKNNLDALKHLPRNNRENENARSQRHLRRWLNAK